MFHDVPVSKQKTIFVMVVVYFFTAKQIHLQNYPGKDNSQIVFDWSV